MTSVLLVALALVAAGAPLDPRDIVWLRKPTGDEVARHVPTESRGLIGRVALDCAVTASGLLSDCRITSDDSVGKGLSEIAIKLAPYFRAALLSKSGAPVAGRRIIIPFRFDLPSDEPPPALQAAPQ
ncbi:MAG: hypothetical protein Q8L23_15155 [Caulobacter sp.]|nr:hypothetical protein [Caulobacter sp.]